VNLPVDREFVAQAVIVAAVCAGAWIMLVQPKAQELARLERQIAETDHAGEALTPQGIEALAARITVSGQRLEEIRRHNAVAEDTSVLYGTIMGLATRRSVRVLAVQPSPLKETAKDSEIQAARLTINVQGRFDDVARFLDDMTGVDAFIRPMSLQVTPADEIGEGAVNVHFGCDVLAFNSDNVLKGAKAASAPTGGANGQS
jgi:hypothetical protein